MTVVEKAEIPVKADSYEAFEATLPQAVQLLRGAAGCHWVSVSKSIERAGTYVLLIEWNSVEAHVEFTKTPEFGQFAGLVKDCFAGASAVEHLTELHRLD